MTEIVERVFSEEGIAFAIEREEDEIDELRYKTQDLVNDSVGYLYDMRDIIDQIIGLQNDSRDPHYVEELEPNNYTIYAYQGLYYTWTKEYGWQRVENTSSVGKRVHVPQRFYDVM